MNRRNVEAIQEATMKTLAAQIERTLSVMRIKGWEFSDQKAAVGVTIVASTPLATKVKARMDEVTLEATISSTNVAEDVAKISDDLVAEWLATHATAKPTKKRRSDGG